MTARVAALATVDYRLSAPVVEPGNHRGLGSITRQFSRVDREIKGFG